MFEVLQSDLRKFVSSKISVVKALLGPSPTDIMEGFASLSV